MNSQQRRKFRRAVEKATVKGLPGNREDTPPHSTMPRVPRKREWFSFSPSTIGVLLTILLGLPALLALRAHPTVSLGTPLDPQDVTTSPFVISNDGVLDLDVVTVASYAVFIETVKHDVERDTSVSETQYAVLAAGDKQTVLFRQVMETDESIKRADIALIITFHPEYMPFWKKTRAFRFRTFSDRAGSLRLEPIASGNVLAMYEHRYSFPKPK